MKKKIDSTGKFKITYNVKGERIYKHIKNGKKRDELLNKRMMGRITTSEMNKEARKFPYLFNQERYEKYCNNLN